MKKKKKNPRQERNDANSFIATSPWPITGLPVLKIITWAANKWQSRPATARLWARRQLNMRMLWSWKEPASSAMKSWISVLVLAPTIIALWKSMDRTILTAWHVSLHEAWDQNCWWLISYIAYRSALRPFVTAAANDIKRGTKIYVPQLDGWEIPGSSKKHNGCLLVDGKERHPTYLISITICSFVLLFQTVAGVSLPSTWISMSTQWATIKPSTKNTVLATLMSMKVAAASSLITCKLSPPLLSLIPLDCSLFPLSTECTFDLCNWYDEFQERSKPVFMWIFGSIGKWVVLEKHNRDNSPHVISHLQNCAISQPMQYASTEVLQS